MEEIIEINYHRPYKPYFGGFNVGDKVRSVFKEGMVVYKLSLLNNTPIIQTAQGYKRYFYRPEELKLDI